jgi:hypothetical protein
VLNHFRQKLELWAAIFPKIPKNDTQGIPVIRIAIENILDG